MTPLDIWARQLVRIDDGLVPTESLGSAPCRLYGRFFFLVLEMHTKDRH